ncbi:hypothetical protein JQX13_08465 [Archangium violaceum]|uniref:hypothetical protein n=1 Tax=Archangium violaceum TaxID=83451 RepID=UPI00193BF960|nr:hypothetical protein [Archangium violaceum]QRK10116.1 hypothetical protein JQX13_08465 [Archangium violaceum]
MTKPPQKLASLLKDDDRHEAAVKMDAELKLELTDEQRDALLKFVDANGRFPSAIEMNLERQIQGNVQRSALFPVTVLVGAMA